MEKEVKCVFCGGRMELQGGGGSVWSTHSGPYNYSSSQCVNCLSRQNYDSRTGVTFVRSGHPLSDTATTALEAENAALREALAPFVDNVDFVDWLGADDNTPVDRPPFLAGDYRRARQALGQPHAKGQDDEASQ